MDNRWCTACGSSFAPRPQVPGQKYCTDPDCQRERKRLWQLAKRQSDPDYLDNQASAQRAWARRNGGYWRFYRETHPEYAAKNRAQQRKRNEKHRSKVIANMDASVSTSLLTSGIYQLKLLRKSDIAKIDVWTVRITVLEAGMI